MRYNKCPVGVQQVFQALEVFSSEGSSAFSVMSAAVSQSNSIELIGKRFQQVQFRILQCNAVQYVN